MSRHLADHNVNPLPLSWERAHQLYEFYCPDRLPEFDSYRSISISSDLEQLLQRLSAIVPTECDPQAVLPKVIEFVNGSVSMLPDPIEFPHKVRAMYYLLGDYYFKQNEVGFILMILLCKLLGMGWGLRNFPKWAFFRKGKYVLGKVCKLPEIF